jgi:quercetin dioxygenase-like cupin family protein
MTDIDSSTDRPEASEPSVISFGAPVEHDTNVRDRERVFNDVRWALVEYAPGSRREGWCTQPHMGYVISGELEYSFEDGRPALRVSAGDGFALPSRPGHAGRNNGSEPARVFVIDALAAGARGEP